MRIPSGVVDQYIYFVAVDATDFTTRETGLSSFTVYRSRNGGAAAAMTTPTINETDTTNMPGVYELLLDEDMTIDSGDDSQEMVFHITHAGMAPVSRTIELYRPKITAGGTLTVSSGIGSANIIQAAGTAWGSGAITAGSIASNAITSAKIAASAIGASQIATDAITAAKIAANAIGASELAADAVTEIQSGLATSAAQTTAQNDLDILTGTDGVTLATSQPNYAPATAAALTTHDGKLDTVDGIVDTILIDTNELQTDWTNGGRLDLIIDELTTQGDTNESYLSGIDSTQGTHTTTLGIISTNVLEIENATFLVNGTIGAVGNTTTTLHLDTLTYGDDELNGLLLVIDDDSTGERHCRWITDWVLSTELATLDSALPFTPQDSTDTYYICSIRRDVDVTLIEGADATDTLGTAQTGDTYALASGATGFTAIDTVVDGIQTDLSNATDGLGALKTLIDAVQTAVDALNDLDAATVNAQVVDALATDTYAEPGQGAPAATAALSDKISYLYKAWRNKSTQTATDYALYADDTTTIDQKATVSDDGTTFTKGEIATGP